MIQDWSTWAVCDERDDPAPSYKSAAEGFIQKNCSNCPVVSECYEEATESDLFWSVRGGRLPTRYNSDISSPRSGPQEKWSPKAPPAQAKYGRSILERGICLAGLHGILSTEDVRSKGCRACQNMKATVAFINSTPKEPTCRNGHPKIPENRGSTQALRNGVYRTETYCLLCRNRTRSKDVCKNGHPKTDEHGRFVDYDVKGKTHQQWSCRSCRNSTRVRGKLGSGTMTA